ncbi:MAG: nucleotidyltransferase domain-containing protein [Rectinemataceae bacterium]|jgi:hypothetical protein
MIHPEIQTRLEALKQILKSHKVKEAYIFGSAVNGRFTKDSDLDLLIEFEKGIDPSEYADLWWDLGDRLEELVQRKVDLVTLSSVRNKYFRMELENTREAIL